MLLSPPKLVCLDTATWGNLARDFNKDRIALRAIELLQDDHLVPFVTWHHLAELVHHGNREVVAARINLLRSLKFVAFPRQPEEIAHVGSAIDLRDAEFSVLLESPQATHSEIIHRVRPLVTNGFARGKDLCENNEEWWLLYRQHFSQDAQRTHAEIAALTHFPTMDEGKVVSDKLGKYTMRSGEEAARYFADLAEQLEFRLRNDVKKLLPNPEELAFGLMRESYEDGIGDYGDEKDGIDWLLKRFDVDRERLPRKPTVGDMGDEAVFVKQLSVHERRLQLPSGTLKQAVRKEMLPSWSVWHELDRAIRRFPKAETGNVNDKMMAIFGLYVDHIQVDKRIRHCVTQLAPKSELFALIKSRLIAAGDYVSLVRELERIGT